MGRIECPRSIALRMDRTPTEIRKQASRLNILLSARETAQLNGLMSGRLRGNTRRRTTPTVGHSPLNLSEIATKRRVSRQSPGMMPGVLHIIIATPPNPRLGPAVNSELCHHTVAASNIKSPFRIEL